MKSSMLTLAAMFVLICSACKRSERSVTNNATTPEKVYNANNFAIPLTQEQFTALTKIFAHEIIKNPTDFLAKVDSIRSEVGTKAAKGVKIVNVKSDNYEEEVAYYAVSCPTTPGFDIKAGTTRTIDASFFADLTFPIRGNQVRVLVPFQYTLGKKPVSNTYTISDIQASKPIEILPAGSGWGKVTPSSWGTNGGERFDSLDRFIGLSAFCTVQEQRMEGHSPQEMANIYNQYSMELAGLVTIGQSAEGDGKSPQGSFYGTITCTDDGVLKNF